MKVNNNNNNGISGNGNSTDLNNISLFDGTEFKSPSSFSGVESTKPIQVSPIQGEILTMEVNNNKKIPYGLNNISLFDGKEFPSPSSFSGPKSTKPIQVSPIQGENPCNHVWSGPIKVPNIFDGDDQYYYVCSSCKMKVPTYEISTTMETGNEYIKKRKTAKKGDLNQQKR